MLYFFNNFAGKSWIFDALVVFFASYLQYFLVAAFLVILYFSAYSKRQKFYIFSLSIISGAIARFGATELIRFFYHRPRPFLLYQLHQFIYKNGGEWSFPSGHSAFFFAMATAIYLQNKKWGAWFFLSAILMNISRIIAGVHYPSDILGGMIIGIAVGFSVFYVAKKIS